MRLLWARHLVRKYDFKTYSDRLGAPHPGELPTKNDENLEMLTDIRWVIDSINQTSGDRFTCLMKAMAGKEMLNRRGIENSLVLGAKLKREGDQEGRPDEAMAAHAWLYAGSLILLGGKERYGFLPVTSYLSP